MSKLNVIQLENCDIYEQLLLEEALLRTTEDNWCILNVGAPPAIVMGISGKPEELIHSEKWQASPTPIIKRFSGGGTVVVDQNTLFVSFILQKEVLPIPAYPEPMLKWSADFYKEALNIPHFDLQENDYAIGHLKCAGNAQYIQKHRVVHHTTFLWDYDQEKMDLLLMPKKIPTYRKRRSHEDFLCRLKNYLPSKSHFLDQIKSALQARYTLEEINEPLELPHANHRIATKLIDLDRGV